MGCCETSSLECIYVRRICRACLHSGHEFLSSGSVAVFAVCSLRVASGREQCLSASPARSASRTENRTARWGPGSTTDTRNSRQRSLSEGGRQSFSNKPPRSGVRTLCSALPPSIPRTASRTGGTTSRSRRSGSTARSSAWSSASPSRSSRASAAARLADERKKNQNPTRNPKRNPKGHPKPNPKQNHQRNPKQSLGAGQRPSISMC